MRLYPCLDCQQPVGWIECPTGGWWAHLEHPDDGHDARIAEKVATEEVYQLALGLEVESEEVLGTKTMYTDWVPVARVLLTDLLERGWRPPVE